jgi:hypothetical protein
LDNLKQRLFCLFSLQFGSSTSDERIGERLASWRGCK